MPASSVIGGNGVITAVYSGDKLYNTSSGTVTVGVNRPAAGSLVVPYITPNPVYKQTPTGNWPYDLVLTEKAGVQTTLTVFTVNGVNNLGAFGIRPHHHPRQRHTRRRARRQQPHRSPQSRLPFRR